MSRIAWWRVLPTCQISLFFALIAVGHMKQVAYQAELDAGVAKLGWGLINAPPTRGDAYSDAAFGINFPAVVLSYLIQRVAGPLGIPDYVLVAIVALFWWAIVGLRLDRYMERSRLPSYAPRGSHPFIAWVGFGGCTFLAAEGMYGAFLAYSAFSLSYFLASLWPLSGAGYFGVKLLQWYSAHRSPLPSIIRTP